MLVLLLSLGDARYGLDVRRVSRVLPAVTLRPVPHAPAGIAGLLPSRDGAIPVVDLAALAAGRPSAARLSTRIVLVGWPVPDGPHTLGLLAESVTEVAEIADDVWQAPPLATPEAPYLGATAAVEGTVVQLLRPEAVLSDDIRRRLFAGEAPA